MYCGFRIFWCSLKSDQKPGTWHLISGLVLLYGTISFPLPEVCCLKVFFFLDFIEHTGSELFISFFSYTLFLRHRSLSAVGSVE